MAASAARPSRPNRDYALGLARAFGGAIIFALPLLMTMEMWSLGFYLDRSRLLLFLLLNLAMLVGLARFVGFEQACALRDDILDALAAYGIGVIAAAVMLALFAIIGPGMSASEIIGKIAIQSIPASFGAIIARKQMADGREQLLQDEAESRAGYGGQLFLMLAGALFVAFNVAPTEEMILIGFKMTPWHELGLVLFSILLLHAFVYAIGFAGQEAAPEGRRFAGAFVCHTIAGYGIALLVSAYVLWTFGRTDGADLGQIASMTVVLGFPSALGAAIARLVV